MPHRSTWDSGTDFIKIMDFLTEEGSNVEDFGAFVGRPDGFGSPDFAQIVNLLMPHRSICVS